LIGRACRIRGGDENILHNFGEIWKLCVRK